MAGPAVAALRALSVRQPWASAIVHAGKDVENRTWPTRYRGLVAIHASAAPESRRAWSRMPAWAAPLLPATLPTGALVGLAWLAGIHRSDDCRLRCSVWATSTGWHWSLTGARPLPLPVPCRGRQGLFTLPVEVACAVRQLLHPSGSTVLTGPNGRTGSVTPHGGERW